MESLQRFLEKNNIFYAIDNYGDNIEWNEILNPFENIYFFKYLKELGIIKEVKFLIKVPTYIYILKDTTYNYFPKVFDNYTEAVEYIKLSINNPNLTFQQKTFFERFQFQMYEIEKC